MLQILKAKHPALYARHVARERQAKRQVAKIGPPSRTNRLIELEERVAQLEAQLAELLPAIRGCGGQDGS